jgi:hypothetical protein
MLASFAAVMLASSACAGEDGDAAAIVAQMKLHWDRPDAPLDAGPVAVATGYAVADWTQGDSGGRALLARRGDGWAVIFCGGDALRSAAGLSGVGVPDDEARELAAELAAAEADVAPARLEAMARFNGLIPMDEGGH